MQHHGVSVRRVNTLKAGKQGFVFVGALRAGGTRKGKLHGSGIERCAVVKFRITAQVKSPNLLVRRCFPLLGQQWLHRAIALNFSERLKHVVKHHLAHGRGSIYRGVKAWRLKHHAYIQAVFGFCLCTRLQAQQPRSHKQCTS